MSSLDGGGLFAATELEGSELEPASLRSLCMDNLQDELSQKCLLGVSLKCRGLLNLTHLRTVFPSAKSSDISQEYKSGRGVTFAGSTFEDD